MKKFWFLLALILVGSIAAADSTIDNILTKTIRWRTPAATPVPSGGTQFYNGTKWKCSENGGAYFDCYATPTPFPTPVPTATAKITNSFLTGYTTANLSNSAINYFSVSGQSTPTATEADVLQLSIATTGTTVVSMTCSVATAPGGATLYTFRFRQFAGNVGAACTISGGATGCTATINSALAQGTAGISYSSVPSGTPTATKVSCALTLSQ